MKLSKQDLEQSQQRVNELEALLSESRCFVRDYAELTRSRDDWREYDLSVSMLNRINQAINNDK